jgi:anti-sigma regulatory factor (Ser/Thr protein kinase)
MSEHVFQGEGEIELDHRRRTTQPMLAVAVNSELDAIAARQRARQIAALCGFGVLDQARIATAVFELARNAFIYAFSGQVRFSVSGSMRRPALMVAIEDAGPGIDHLAVILAGRYRSTTGLGLGILAARRLMDRCEISTGKRDGTTITLSKALPADSPVMTQASIAKIVSQLDDLPDDVVLSEAHQQNREMTDALGALQAR